MDRFFVKGLAALAILICSPAAGFAQTDIYDSCVAKLESNGDDAYCGGLVKGYSLGYDRGFGIGASIATMSRTTNGFVPTGGLVVGTEGFGIGGDKPFVFQPAGPDSEPLVFEPAAGNAKDLTTIGKGPYTFDLEKFKTVPLSTWIADNPGKVDIDQLKALQGAVGEFGGDKPAIYEIPGSAQ